MTIRRFGSILVATSLVVAACGGDESGTEPSGTEPVATPAGGSVAVPARLASTADPAPAGTSVSEFGFELLAASSAAAGPTNNVVVSPLSVAIALALAEPGASGDAVAQFHQLLGIDDPVAWRQSLAALELALEARQPDPVVDTGGDDEQSPGELHVNVADAAFVRPGYPFRDDYLDVLGTVFGAHLEELDFADPEAAAARINDFVAGETDDRITDLVPPSAIDPDATVLALVNALLLQASWMSVFDEARTVDGTFTTAAGTEVTVPMMHGASERSGRGDGWVGAMKPLVGRLALEVVLPDEGRFDEVAGRFGQVIGELAASPNPGGDLVVPRFETRVNTELTGVLQDMGLVAPFGPGSMLGVADDPDTAISDVLHETWLSIDEDGIEAAAATVVLAVATSAPIDEPVPVVLDRPFLFRIVDTVTGATLFAGRIADPTA